ncbi:MAG: hypothetical protein II919_02345 [Lachnospiraceae bacterium]|nr:hypothetical protein [Lachnospiraceae bacterium]
MKADYKNRVPKGMIYGMFAGTAGLAATYLDVGKKRLEGKSGLSKWL